MAIRKGLKGWNWIAGVRNGSDHIKQKGFCTKSGQGWRSVGDVNTTTPTLYEMSLDDINLLDDVCCEHYIVWSGVYDDDKPTTCM